MAIQSNFPAIKPSLMLDFASTKQLDPRITFTRASTATFYNGVTTAMAEQNLFTYSQDFSNAAWTKSNVSVTANANTAPDGTTTSATLTANAGLSVKILTQGPTPVASSAYGMTFFAKAGTNNFIQLMNAGDGQAFANFDLSTGTVGTTGTKTTASTVSFGNGWYRCIVIFNTTSTLTAAFRLYMVASNTATFGETLNATGSETVYLWGAQLEQRTAVTAYTATTTQAITNYIPKLQSAASGVARFDNNPTTGESLGLLIEESRTNLATYSEQFDNAAWVTVNTSVTANTVVSPDGTLNADKLIPNSTVGGHFIGQNITTTAVANTFSVYLKAGGYNWAVLYIAGVNAGIYFNLSNGTTGSNFISAPTSSSITAVGNGWYRCSITATLTTASTLRIYSASADATSSFAGDGFSGLFLWGVQLEVGAFATSYIPTVASQVTRAADNASMTGTNFSSWYNQAEGTLYAEAQVNFLSAQTRMISINDGTTQNRILAYTPNAATTIQYIVSTSSVSQVSIVRSIVSSSFMNKQAVVYKQNDFAASTNGSVVGTDDLGTVPVVDRLTLGFEASFQTTGTIKKIAYYPLRVTNTQLQALTS